LTNEFKVSFGVFYTILKKLLLIAGLYLFALHQMKKLNLSLLFVFVATMLFFSSCGTVEISQRRYNKGFNVAFAWQHKDQKQVKTKSVKMEAPAYMGIELDATYTGFDVNHTEEKTLTTIGTKEINAEKTLHFASEKKVGKRFEKLKKTQYTQPLDQFNIAKSGINNTIIATTMASKIAPEHTAVASKPVLIYLIFIGIFFSILPAWLIEGGWTINTKINALLYLIALMSFSFGLGIWPTLFLLFLPFFHLLYIIFS
jgi:hypothetical protein